MKNLRDGMLELAKELEAEENAAFDLWSWLPSCKLAAKYHGDYYVEHQPCTADIMREACDVFAGETEKSLLTTTCPCGEGCESKDPE